MRCGRRRRRGGLPGESRRGRRRPMGPFDRLEGDGPDRRRQGRYATSGRRRLLPAGVRDPRRRGRAGDDDRRHREPDGRGLRRRRRDGAPPWDQDQLRQSCGPRGVERLPPLLPRLRPGSGARRRARLPARRLQPLHGTHHGAPSDRRTGLTNHGAHWNLRRPRVSDTAWTPRPRPNREEERPGSVATRQGRTTTGEPGGRRVAFSEPHFGKGGSRGPSVRPPGARSGRASSAPARSRRPRSPRAHPSSFCAPITASSISFS